MKPDVVHPQHPAHDDTRTAQERTTYRTPYAPPRLECLGPWKALTLADSQGLTEITITP